MNILSLNPHGLGDWIFKVSVNSMDEYILIVACHPITKYSFLKSFKTPELARDWVLKVSKLPGIVDFSEI